MIQPLRNIHRRTFLVLAPALFAALAIGVAGRQAMPEMDKDLEGTGSMSRSSASILWERDDLFANHAIKVRLVRQQRMMVTCSAVQRFDVPDLLLYWTADGDREMDGLPAHAILLGAFRSPLLPLPSAAEGRTGVLILFSLADRTVVAVSKPVIWGPDTNPGR